MSNVSEKIKSLTNNVGAANFPDFLGKARDILEDRFFADRERFGPSLDFSYLREPLTIFADFLQKIIDQDTSLLLIDDNGANNIRSHIDEVLRLIDWLTRFQIGQETDRDARTNVDQFCQHLGIIINAIAPVIMLDLARPKSDSEIQNHLSKLEATLSAAEQKLADISDKDEEAQKKLSAIEDAAAKSGVAENYKAFDELAGQINKKRLCWLVTTIIFASLILAYIFDLMFGWTLSMFGWTSSWQGEYLASEPLFLFLTRAGILAVLTTGALWCGSIYRALSRDYYAHCHRATTLQTFKAFIEGTGNQRVKDGILAEAARAAFQVSDPSGKGAQQSPQFNISVGKDPASISVGKDPASLE